MRRPALALALAAAASAATVRETLELREWVVDYQRPTAAPRQLPFNIPTPFKMAAALANDAFPGPAIEAQLGDTIEVTVVNQMLAKGAEIVFEGVQVTRAAPGLIPQQGANFTYQMTATKAGTFWWHAKVPQLAAQGLKGALVVRTPAPPPGVNYQEERTVVLADAMQDPEVCLSPTGVSDMGCPEIDKATLNGQWGDGSKAYPFPAVTVMEGKCYRMRWLGLQSQAGAKFEVEIKDHLVTVVGQTLPVNSFSVPSGGSTDVVLCANNHPVFSQDYDITLTYQGKASKAFAAKLRYAKNPQEPDFNV